MRRNYFNSHLLSLGICYYRVAFLPCICQRMLYCGLGRQRFLACSSCILQTTASATPVQAAAIVYSINHLCSKHPQLPFCFTVFHLWYPTPWLWMSGSAVASASIRIGTSRGSEELDPTLTLDVPESRLSSLHQKSFQIRVEIATSHTL